MTDMLTTMRAEMEMRGVSKNAQRIGAIIGAKFALGDIVIGRPKFVTSGLKGTPELWEGYAHVMALHDALLERRKLSLPSLIVRV